MTFKVTARVETPVMAQAKEKACRACEFWQMAEPGRCCHPKVGCPRWHGRRYPWRSLRACPAGQWPVSK